MTKNSYHTEVERAQTVGLHKNGPSQRQISKELSISKSFIPRAIAKFKTEGIYANKKKSGRPRKTTSRDDITMNLDVGWSPTSSCQKIRSNLSNPNPMH